MDNFGDYNNGDDWQQYANQQANDAANAQRNQMFSNAIASQQDTYKNFSGIVDVDAQQNAQTMVGIQNQLAACYKLTMDGRINNTNKPKIINEFNRVLQKDGQGQQGSQLVDFGMDNDGNFIAKFAQNGANGLPQYSQMNITPQMQYSMALNNPGIFSATDANKMYSVLLNKGGVSASALNDIYRSSLTGMMSRDNATLGNRIAQNGYQAGGRLIGGTNGRVVMNSQSGNLTNGQMTDSGAVAGYRPRFVSQDDVNGTEYMQPNGEGTRYRGNGIHTFSTTDFQEDRANAKNPNGQWKMLSSGNTDVKGGTVTKARWENSRTGEVMELDPGESPSTAMSKMDKAKLAQVQAEARLRDAQANAGGFRPYGSSSGTKGNATTNGNSSSNGMNAIRGAISSAKDIAQMQRDNGDTAGATSTANDAVSLWRAAIGLPPTGQKETPYDEYKGSEDDAKGMELDPSRVRYDSNTGLYHILDENGKDTGRSVARGGLDDYNDEEGKVAWVDENGRVRQRNRKDDEDEMVNDDELRTTTFKMSGKKVHDGDVFKHGDQYYVWDYERKRRKPVSKATAAKMYREQLKREKMESRIHSTLFSEPGDDGYKKEDDARSDDYEE